MDIIVAARSSGSLVLYKNDGSNAFARQSIGSGLENIRAVAVADVDGMYRSCSLERGWS
jgi:hypothetical protein